MRRSLRLLRWLHLALAEENAHFSDSYERHTNRLYNEVRWLPCSPSCANWLRYGVTPNTPAPDSSPGQCLSPAHDRENLGPGGRRVLVSRPWSGKTLTEHRADWRTVVTEVLTAVGIDPGDADRLAAEPNPARRHTSVHLGRRRSRFGRLRRRYRRLTAASPPVTRTVRTGQTLHRATPFTTCGDPFGNETKRRHYHGMNQGG